MNSGSLTKSHLKARVHETLAPLGFELLRGSTAYDLVLPVDKDFRILFADEVYKKRSHYQIEPVIALECIPMSRVLTPQSDEPTASVGYAIVGASLEARKIWEFYCLIVDKKGQVQETMEKLYRVIDEHYLPLFLRFASSEKVRDLIQDHANRKSHHGIVVPNHIEAQAALERAYGLRVI